MSDKIQVLYVEDDEDWRNGIAAFFAGHQEIELFDCVPTVKDSFRIIRQRPVDVVIMDIILDDADTSGLDAALDIKVQYPEIKVIMLSYLDQQDEIFNEAFLNGAYDYLYKNDFEQLPDVIRAAVGNKASKYGERLRKLVYEKKKRLVSDGDSRLLKLILEGKSQSQIAEELNISLAAIKKQIGRVKKKFNWEKSSFELAEKCKKWELLDS